MGEGGEGGGADHTPCYVVVIIACCRVDGYPSVLSGRMHRSLCELNACDEKLKAMVYILVQTRFLSEPASVIHIYSDTCQWAMH